MPVLKRIITCLTLLAFMGSSFAYADGLNILRDEEIEQSLKTMSRPVFSQAGLSADTVKFILVDSQDLNAFVAGGQNIFLFSHLILETQNAAELFGVIAHETGHIADGHLFRGQVEMSNLSLQAMLTSILGVAVAIGARAPGAGMAIGTAGSSISERQFLRHTRTQEGSADQAGVRFLQGARLPVTGFLSFMKKLASQELLPESQQSEYVRTHPLTQDRIDYLEHVTEGQQQGATPPDWDELHRRIKAKLQGYLFPDRALQMKDDSVATQYGHAIAWFRKGNLERALTSVDALIKAEPENPYFYELKGQMLFENGRIEESIPAYQKAVGFAPFSGLIRIAYAHSLLESKADKNARMEEAVKQLNLALQKERHIAEPHYLLAIAYGKMGQEGLSRLHLAEENLMQNKISFAKREAVLARASLKKGTPAYQRAQDILDMTDKNKEKDQEKD